MFLLWLKTTLFRRPVHVLGTALGIALTVALLASLGSFVTHASSRMTARAVSTVPVDWQVQIVPGVDPQTVVTEIRQATATTAVKAVDYADVTGFRAVTGGTEQTTGKGKVLGIPTDYATTFPGQIRSLLGPPDVTNGGVLIAQQTAANLHVGIGDTVTVQRLGIAPVDVKITGVIDLPNADALFQAVGIPKGAAPQAPPDNVLVMAQDPVANVVRRPRSRAPRQHSSPTSRYFGPRNPAAQPRRRLQRRNRACQQLRSAHRRQRNCREQLSRTARRRENRRDLRTT